MKHRIRTAIAGIFALFVATAAVAQTFPTVPGRTVIGRLGTAGVSGPSQAIPFATLAAQLYGSQRPIVILATGQSNLTRVPAFAWSPAGNAKLWNFSGVDGNIGTAYAALSSTTVNASWKLASDIAAANPTRQICLINISFAGQTISHWLSGTSAPDVYANILANITSALSACGATNIDLFTMWQGESDTANTSYVANWATMIARFKTNSWFLQETPIIIFGIAPTSISGDSGSDKVNNYLQIIAGVDSDKRRFVYPGSLSAASWVDTLHMTGAGYYSVGAMAASAFINGPGRAAMQGLLVNPVTGFVNIGGYGTADALLTVNSNTALPATAIDGGTSLHIVGPDALNHNSFYDSYGGSNVIVARRRDGTIASPAAVASAAQVFSQQARAWNGTTLPSIATFDALTVNAQTGLDNSSKYRMRLIPSGSTTIAEYHSWLPGSYTINGLTSGSVTLAVPAVSGSNTITLPAGTTDFSATGGASQVVKQTTAGGAFTVARLACADLSDATLCGGALGTGVLTALGVNVGTAGSFVVNGGALGSPSSAGTLPAFTLGGTIAGGGNQINNIIIGTITPLAGSFTSLAWSTTLIGTSTNASALAVGRQGATDPAFKVDASTASSVTGINIKSAAAAAGVALSVISSGINESLTIDAKGSGPITLGATSTGDIRNARNTTISSTAPSVAADALLVVNANTAASVAPPITPQLHIVGADAGNAGIGIHAYGNKVRFEAIQANGTQAAKTASSVASDLFGFNAYGWNTTAYGVGGQFTITPSETWSATAQGTHIRFNTTPATTTATAEALRIQDSGCLSVGTVTACSIGQIYTNSAAFMIGTRTSYTNGAGAGAGTIANAPAAGNPTKWIPVNDNGTTRYIPAW